MADVCSYIDKMRFYMYLSGNPTRLCGFRRFAALLVCLFLSPSLASAHPLGILITNDDAIDHLGIVALAEQLGKKHEVLVFAPDDDKSGNGSAFGSTNGTYRITPRRKDGKLFGYAIAGTLYVLRRVSA